MGRKVKNRLILISDINGLGNSPWIKDYESVLRNEFQVVKYCSLELANIPSNLTQDETHNQLVNGGIDLAVKNIIELEPNAVTVIGFSVGGSIAWKAGLQGLAIASLYAVSSTRLRKETHKPIGELKLIFGEDDAFVPSEKWYHDMEIIPRILPDEGHNFYKKQEFIKQFASQINWANGIIY